MDSIQQITLKKIGPVCTKLEDPRWFEIDVEESFHVRIGNSRLTQVMFRVTEVYKQEIRAFFSTPVCL